MVKLSSVLALLVIVYGCREMSVINEYNKMRKNGSNVFIQADTLLTAEEWILSDVILAAGKGDSVRGRVRWPVDRDLKYPVAFLIVGIETGKEVVGMISGYDSVIVFSIDYPYSGDFDFSGWKGITTLLALRTVGFRSIRHIGVSLDWLESQASVDTNNISIIAVSFGVFTGVPSAVIDGRVDRLAVVQAGGDLQKILEANSERLHASVPPWFAGWLGSIILAPFEPNRYIDRFSPRPFLLVSGESDKLFPSESMHSLYNRAGEPKEWIKHTSGHVDPAMERLIAELTEIVGNKLYPSKKQ